MPGAILHQPIRPDNVDPRRHRPWSIRHPGASPRQPGEAAAPSHLPPHGRRTSDAAAARPRRSRGMGHRHRRASRGSAGCALSSWNVPAACW